MLEAFETILKLCKLSPGEVVLIFTDIDFPHPDYASNVLRAAHKIGAEGYILTAGEMQSLQDPLIRAAWLQADLLLGMSFLPGNFSWMYTDLHNEALKAGARVLMVQEPPTVLLRLLPNPVVFQRGKNGAALMKQAKYIRVTSEDGTDLTASKEGRKGAFQCGFVDEPGKWDHWPSGMVYCAPLENSADGILVVRPGDALIGMGLWQHAKQEIRFTFKNGRITDINGGEEAGLIREKLEQDGNEVAFRLAHMGWGLDDRADWACVGMDSESFMGNVTIALGRNIFDTPHIYCGMGGQNRAGIHFDMCLLHKSMYLDEKIVIDRGVIDYKLS